MQIAMALAPMLEKVTQQQVVQLSQQGNISLLASMLSTGLTESHALKTTQPTSAPFGTIECEVLNRRTVDETEMLPSPTKQVKKATSSAKRAKLNDTTLQQENRMGTRSRTRANTATPR